MGAVVKAIWSGFTGAPGTSTFMVIDASQDSSVDPTSAALTSAVGAIRQFFNGCASNLAASVVISFEGEAVLVDEQTGVVRGAQTYTVPSPVVGSGSSSVAAPAGASVRWRTGSVINGRRVNGRTYLVPLYAGAYESNGSLQTTSVSAILTAAQALVTTSNASSTFRMAVWHRPGTGAGGFAAPFTGATIKDEVAVLTSRRN